MVMPFGIFGALWKEGVEGVNCLLADFTKHCLGGPAWVRIKYFLVVCYRKKYCN